MLSFHHMRYSRTHGKPARKWLLEKCNNCTNIQAPKQTRLEESVARGISNSWKSRAMWISCISAKQRRMMALPMDRSILTASTKQAAQSCLRLSTPCISERKFVTHTFRMWIGDWIEVIQTLSYTVLLEWLSRPASGLREVGHFKNWLHLQMWSFWTINGKNLELSQVSAKSSLKWQESKLKR